MQFSPFLSSLTVVMATYLALFRGINIGGHHKLPMSDLSALLEKLGCRKIRTYSQSGNVVFETRRRNRVKLANDIRETISDSYGFSPKVVLLTKVDLQKVMANNPFPSNDGKALSVIFMTEQPEAPRLDRLASYKSQAEDFAFDNNVLYLYVPNGMGRSRLAMNVERCLGVPSTGRNWNTLQRLAEMFE